LIRSTTPGVWLSNIPMRVQQCAYLQLAAGVVSSEVLGKL